MAESMENMGTTAGQFLATAGHKVGSALHGLEESAMGAHEYPGLKLRIMTWNMHGKIPKGDLEILFGHVDPYNPADAPRLGPDEIPPLPMNDAHPYHLVVISCQECPWGEGGQLTTTLHTAGEIGSAAFGRSRRARDLYSGEHRHMDASGKGTGADTQLDLQRISSVSSTAGGLPLADSPSTRSTRPALSIRTDGDAERPMSSPVRREAASGPARTKVPGWSKVCEDWFCYATSPNSPEASPYVSPTDRADSDTDSLVSEQWPSRTHGLHGLTHQLSRASLRGDNTSDRSFVSPQDMRQPPQRLGPYELVIKKRMMGCYSAVYVWRGCHELVRGASANYVKSGLLAGRMGNKGGVGISILFAKTRLLFVNAHLAAHANKIAARFDNIQRISTELRVETFLPPDDPRNKLEDITAKFDHVFWCGDLNFRVEINRKDADALIQQKAYHRAFQYDQLQRAMHEGKIFQHFEEAPITFPPTYKFDILKAADARDVGAADEASFVTADDSFGSQRPKPTDAPEMNTGTLAPRSPSPDTVSLSNFSESSSIMEDAADDLNGVLPTKEVTTGNTLSPIRPNLVHAVKEEVQVRKKENATIYALGNATYDSSAKQRVPSWCDRVLWRTNDSAPHPTKHRAGLFGRRRDASSHREEDAVVRSLIQAPLHWLHGKGQDTAAADHGAGKGTVTVLTYRSIDDLDSEALGATSDHRPVLFSAFVRT
ncbi:hypothetical protein MBRA1_003853 [Malassezia brasiliensis]|uniref:Inositol polyphosphate-related phosphatase domain-containing protein n=1 Tax=Malassezia brasiliensis TaxID=1821822 RepID=A0AAF0IQ81_9BASI|nr:hypothetical protein MBRA1_003853 [Malassezia brasiliensis]